MKTNSTFTKSRLGLDNNVWLVMFSTTLLSLGLCGYIFINKKEDKPCAAVNLVINGRTSLENISFNAGESLTFRSNTLPTQKVLWDFGDNSKKEGSTVVHSFTHASIYRVRAIVDGRCDYEKRITINEVKKDIVFDSAGNLTENIIGENFTTTGKTTKMSTPLAAENYEWHVDNNKNFLVRTGKEVSYNFKKEGNYTIVLILDHDNKKRYTKEIVVSKSEEDILTPAVLIRVDTIKKKEPDPVKDTVTRDSIAPDIVTKTIFKVISDETFKDYLQNLVCKTMQARDFNQYLCQEGNTKVVINKTQKTFATMFDQLKGKNIRIESVKATRNGDDCVVLLTITYDKRPLGLSRNPCKD